MAVIDLTKVRALPHLAIRSLHLSYPYSFEIGHKFSKQIVIEDDIKKDYGNPHEENIESVCAFPVCCYPVVLCRELFE
jgi:hypothetical protein